MKRTILSSLAGGLILFAWGMISHAFLPWYDTVYHEFTNETAMTAVLQDNAPVKGIYYLPHDEANAGAGRLGAFVNVLPQGPERTVTSKMLSGILIQIVAAFLVICLVRNLLGSSYWRRVSLFSLIGVIIGFASHSYYWNWFEFPSIYAGISILDSLVGWSLAGLAIAGLMTERAEQA